MHTVPMSAGYDVLNVSGALAALLMGTYLGIRHFPSRDLVSGKGCRRDRHAQMASYEIRTWLAQTPDVRRRPDGCEVCRSVGAGRQGAGHRGKKTPPAGRGGDADDVSVAASGASSSRLRDRHLCPRCPHGPAPLLVCPLRESILRPNNVHR
jgi:hypothetical protein